MKNERSSFTGKIGFVLAAAGSAVGLGNIWRFPYLAAKYGGGIFLLTYLVLAVTFGFTLMVTEIAIGRKTGLSAIGAFKKLNSKFSFIGWLGALVPMIILPYYSVIGGWVSKYLYTFIAGPGRAMEEGIGFFNQFVSQPAEPLIWFLIFLGITAVVVFLGVEKGVEKVSKVMMPILICLSVVIAGYTLFLPGAMEGVRYYFMPDFSKFSVELVLGAMGQLFYSMSLAMGIMITYGSYMKKDVSIESAVHQIEFFDTGIAILAGLMIVPATFALSGGGELNQGPGLMFGTLPQVFERMLGGQFIGILFFLLVLFAALTSSISLMETVVSIVQDKLRWTRTASCIIVFVGALLLGIPSSLGNGAWSGVLLLGKDILSFFDFISNSVMMPIVALLTCIFVGYVLKPKTLIEEVERNMVFRSKKLYTVVLKYIAPVCILLILLTSILETLGILAI
ncbi:MAG: sodium-dependent transporter [Ruminococcaceae bacterium]|nr:sodium-dependent transporter [Oscillospiraceae bacterium]